MLGPLTIRNQGSRSGEPQTFSRVAEASRRTAERNR